jgi:hypothetical protein
VGGGFSCPDGATACSLGLAAVCQPQVGVTLQVPGVPKGRRQLVAWDRRKGRRGV